MPETRCPCGGVIAWRWWYDDRRGCYVTDIALKLSAHQCMVDKEPRHG